MAKDGAQTDRGRTLGLLLAVGATCALGGAIATVAVAPARSAATGAPIDSSDISEAVGTLAPNCRMIAMRRLRWRLDSGQHAALDRSDLDQVVSPLRRGGADMCDAAIGQRFFLGGS
jgi:hypothetical protein